MVLCVPTCSVFCLFSRLDRACDAARTYRQRLRVREQVEKSCLEVLETENRQLLAALEDATVPGRLSGDEDAANPLTTAMEHATSGCDTNGSGFV